MDPILSFAIVVILSVGTIVVMEKLITVDVGHYVVAFFVFCAGCLIIGSQYFDAPREYVGLYGNVDSEPQIVQIFRVEKDYVLVSDTDWDRVWKIDRSHIQEIAPLDLEHLTDSTVSISSRIEGTVEAHKKTTIDMAYF